MASIISSGTTSGTALNFSGDTSGVLQLATNGTTTALSISTAQVVTLTNALPVTSGGTGVTTSTGTGANVLGTSPTIATPTMTGQATIPTINLTGGQIAFPATQSASSDANTLDDYEEGTWTPTFTAAVSAPSSVTYSVQQGRYTKIGRVVYIEFYLRFTAYSGGSGTANVGGLPFTAAGAPYSGFYLQENAGFSVTGTFYSLNVQVNASATTASILKLAPNASSAGVPIGEIATSSTVYVIASGCYTTT